MNEKRKFDKLVRTTGAEERDKLLEDIRSRCGLARKEDKKKAFTGGRLVTVISCCFVAVCVAIILPCVLLLGGKDTGGVNDSRYFGVGEIRAQRSQYTLKEYNNIFGTDFLFLDWYGEPNDCLTDILSIRESEERIGLRESITNIGTLDSIQIQLMKTNVHVDYLDELADLCAIQITINGTQVDWSYQNEDLFAVFENGDYRYYFTLHGSSDDERFFELLTELLEGK
ncbi:MAG: hypothetical protein NC311_09845 [Muribaculaceae bacterium]|nr:hypothetical protein [Muribaculaceae bacterium]